MRSLNLLITVSLLAPSLSVEAAPRRNVIEQKRPQAHSPQRGRSSQFKSSSSEPRRVINARPANNRSPERKVISPPPPQRNISPPPPRRTDAQSRARSRTQRRVIDARPANNRSPERRVISPPPRRSEPQRAPSARSAEQHRRASRVERRKSRRAEQRHSKRFERRSEQRRHNQQFRDRAHRVRHRHGHHSRVIPTYVAAPTRVVITHSNHPHYNDDLFFDHMYHDGNRYGINGDFRDEERRINRGIRMGLITPREADRLTDLLLDAYDLETDCIEDGYITESEEAELYWAERNLNRAIRWEMRDFEVW